MLKISIFEMIDHCTHYILVYLFEFMDNIEKPKNDGDEGI